jgi:hypothetical protein
MSRLPAQNHNRTITLENTAFPAARPVRRRCLGCHHRQELIALQAGPGSRRSIPQQQRGDRNEPFRRQPARSRSSHRPVDRLRSASVTPVRSLRADLAADE